MKKILFIITLLFLFSFLFTPLFPVEARQPRLEIDYPDIPGVPTPTIEGGISNYVKYIFNFAIWASGFIALAVLIYAGFKYLTSAGNIERISDAKNQITAAILGMVILFGSYLILPRINPQLIAFNLEEVEPVLSTLGAGVLLCEEPVDEIFNFYTIKDSAKGKTLGEQEIIQQQLDEILIKISEKCRYARSSGPVPKDFDNKATIVYLIPENTTKYGAIIYDEGDFRGSSDALYTLNPGIISYDIKVKPSSVRCFIINDEPSVDWYAELYELKDYNEANEAANWMRYSLGGFQDDCWNIVQDFPQITKGDNHQFGSVKIEGNLVVIFFVDTCESPWTENTEIYVLVQSDHNLYDNRPINDWDEKVFGDWGFGYPSARSMVIVSADMF